MSRTALRAALAGAYAATILVPLALIAGIVKPGANGRLVVFADALGFAAVSLIALQIVSSGKWAATTRAFGLRRVLALHRHAGIAVLVLVVAHIAVLVADDPSRLALLDSATAPPRARAGMAGLVGLGALAATSAWRRRLRLSYERWKALHLALTVVVLAAAFAHLVWVDSYMSFPAVRWTTVAIVVLAAAALFWSRIARPYTSATRPYLVQAITPERGDALTLELRPEQHRGVRFAPGQFARLRHASYAIDDHPFSLSSSAGTSACPQFTVKALGDFSKAVRDLRVGDRILLDGPHGEPVHDAPPVRGRLLIAAGIGITPALSVIRTAAEQGDARPLLLLYGSRRQADVTFWDELRELQRRLPSLRVVHVLSRPTQGWIGERGRLSETVLRRHAPTDVSDWSALLCGPPSMVDELSEAVRRLGVPPSSIQAEGFS
ncbi:ferredoxin reductase family protein [Solirubrobacter soli]|uniref:ferredoxin reductase family protein n=1 Tax=Solirubrobacter soli TaxID=363832 RepID=UPI00041251A8|nr:ferredoxin reductase family protein [Solirubrobacter soli]